MRCPAALLSAVIACGGAKPVPDIIATAPVATAPAAPSASAAPSSGVTLSFEDKTSGGREALLQASAEHHLAVLTTAAAKSAYEVHVSLKKAARTERIACGVEVAIIARPSQDLVAVVSGDAIVEGADDTALADCIEGLVKNLFETRGVAALRAANAQ
jgi:hypothetical protein